MSYYWLRYIQCYILQANDISVNFCFRFCDIRLRPAVSTWQAPVHCQVEGLTPNLICTRPANGLEKRESLKNIYNKHGDLFVRRQELQILIIYNFIM